MSGFLSKDKIKGVQREGLAKALTEAKSPAERRRAETVFMRPDPLPDYKGPPPTNKGVREMAVMCLFTRKRDWELFIKHMRVNRGGGIASCHRMELIGQMLELIEAGELVVEEGKLHVCQTCQ